MQGGGKIEDMLSYPTCTGSHACLRILLSDLRIGNTSVRGSVVDPKPNPKLFGQVGSGSVSDSFFKKSAKFRQIFLQMVQLVFDYRNTVEEIP